MKFLVDEMPKEKGKCPFCEWQPYPPFIEEPGRWVCKIAEKKYGNKTSCDLKADSCSYLRLYTIQGEQNEST